MPTTLTFLGHSTFALDTPRGKKFYFDAWLKDNPACPEELKTVDRADAFFVTHGHSDHLEPDLTDLATKLGAMIVVPEPIRVWMWENGFHNSADLNIGGTTDVAGVSVTMTLAFHYAGLSQAGSSAFPHYPAGYVLRSPGMPTIYYAGDTGVFADMQVIGHLYKPEIAILPIGDVFTMGPYEAAYAAEMLGAKTVIPMHYGTYPEMTGTVEAFKSHLKPGITCHEMKPGESAAF